MRKFITNTALEAHQNPVEIQVLSLEEEIFEATELHAAGTEIESDLGEANRVIEVSDCLEDIADIADGVEEAKPTDLALIEAAGQMAVAGTPVQGEEVIPAMEAAQFLGKKIATEDIRNTAKAIWEKIRAFVKDLWKKIEGFFYRYLGQVPRYRKAVEDLEKRLGELEGKSVGEKKVSLLAGIAALSVDYKPVLGAAELKKAVSTLLSAGEQTYGALQDNILQAGEACAAALDKFDAEKAEETAKALVGKLQSTYHSAPTGAGSDNKRFPGFETLQGNSLLGNKSIVLKRASKSVIEHGTLAALDKMRHSGYKLMDTSESSQKAGAVVEMAPLSVADAKALLEDAKKLLSLVEEFRRGAKAKKISDVEKKLDSASSKATTAMEKAMTAEAGARGTVAYYRALVNFNQAYGQWAYDPAGPMARLIMDVVGGIRMVVSKSIACYEAPKAAAAE